jgi:hypothetical protein
MHFYVFFITEVVSFKGFLAYFHDKHFKKKDLCKTLRLEKL